MAKYEACLQGADAKHNCGSAVDAQYELVVEMPRSPGLVKQVDSAILGLLVELANQLVAAGISYPRFDAMVRLAYFQAAASGARFSNNRVNQSAVAAMTGLTRVEVRQFAKQVSPDHPRPKDRVHALIEGWLTDRSFTTASGAPRRLRVRGGGNSFTSLVRIHGGDVSANALLRELQRHKLVTVRGGCISINPSARRSREEIRIEQLTKAISTFLAVPVSQRNTKASLQTINLEVRYPTASEKGRAALNKRVAENLRLFLAGVEAAGAAAACDSPPLRSGRRGITRTRVLLATEEEGR